MKREGDPKCACFEDKIGRRTRETQVTLLVQELGRLAAGGADQMGLCDETLPYILENLIINIATIIALKGTIIEMGTQEAQWETERVLAGIEGRVVARLRSYYEESRHRGITAANYQDILQARGETKQ